MMKNIFKKKNILWLAIISISIAFSATVLAAYAGRAEYYGYFLNQPDYHGGVVLPVLYSNQAIPNDINTVALLVQVLKDANNSSNKQRITGSAFIVNTMLSRNGGDFGVAKKISDKDWTEVTARLEDRQGKGLIDWNYSVYRSNFVNSYYQGISQGKPGETNPDDDALYTQSGSDPNGAEPSILIKNDDGSVVYELLRRCANPVGSLSGLPKVNWSPSVSTTVSPTSSITVGTIITWQHNAVVIGAQSTNKDIKYWAVEKGANISGSKIIPSGSVVGTSGTFTSNHTITSSDIGKNICRSTSASPKSSSDNGTVTSADACVYVPNPINACRPIVINIPRATLYPAVSHTAMNGAYFYTPPTLVVMDAVINGVVVGTNDSTASEKIVDLTANYTTGDNYNVTYRERATHVTGYYDTSYTNHSGDVTRYYDCSYDTYSYDSETGDWIKTGTVSQTCSWVDHSNDYEVYTGTVTVYGGPSSSGSSFGPCYDYSLVPDIGVSSRLKVEPGENIVINSTVSSSSWTQSNMLSFWNQYHTHSKTKPSTWEITKLKFASDVFPTAKVAATSIMSPCSYFRSGEQTLSCETYISGSSTVFNNSLSYISTANDAAPDDTAGTKLCYVVSVRSSQSDPLNTSSVVLASDSWSHSAFNPTTNCVVIVKKPKVQVLGGDVWSRTDIKTSTSIKGGNAIFGSWAEYGLFALNNISGMASGSAFASNSGLVSNDQTGSGCDYNTLTFASAGDSKCSLATVKGGYNTDRSLPNVSASFPITGALSYASGTSLSSLGSGVTYTATGNITIPGGDIAKSKWVVINAPNASVTITGNISYYAGSDLKSINDIPQVIIIAKNIDIAENVENVDAWLIADNGYINTCSSGGLLGNLYTKTCSDLLTINGPVVASKLYLRRTAGSGTGLSSGDPAEIINLRADAYLWAYARAITVNRIQTVYTTENPPRL